MNKGIKEYRSIGIQEYRNIGIQEYRNTGMQEYRKKGIPDIYYERNLNIIKLFTLICSQKLAGLNYLKFFVGTQGYPGDDVG